MQADEYDTMRETEDRHWWYAVLRYLVWMTLPSRLPPRAHVLDAGCGTGGMLRFLQREIPFIETAGIDVSEHALQYCRSSGLDQVSMGSVHALPFADGEFDAVLSLDVLYHEGVDENLALQEMRRVLRPGGVLVMNLPAFESLRGSHDTAVCGARRYRMCHVQRLLKVHSFDLVMNHYWNAWLFLPLLVWRCVSRRRLQNARSSCVASDLRMSSPALNALLTFAGRADAFLCRTLRIPFGSSLFVVASRAHVPPPDHGNQ
jgi:SAM-dependent methyltransferase